ncbi:hypothetical protein B7P43_G09165 [Cryptotermes secundus]|uniref:PiggyBac transposable element-derived protein domain-containing protein n=1 Tax=Cryptotermes secundus TaxID=105785 RepID=A0A2J7QA15_9NEOP|nr:hypothetical protein B7P43_G09165 [Cryptotermes secundus]
MDRDAWRLLVEDAKAHKGMQGQLVRLISDMKTMLVSVEDEKEHHFAQLNKEWYLTEKMTELRNKSYARIQEEIDLMKTLIKLQSQELDQFQSSVDSAKDTMKTILFIAMRAEFNIDCELLITHIEERPVLWDKSSEGYKDRRLTLQAWKDICSHLKEDFETLGDKERNDLGKDRTRADQDVTATHATVMDLCRRIEGVGHKLYMDNFFSSPDLFEELMTKDITCCGTVRPNRKCLPDDFRRRQFRLKKVDIRVRVRRNLTVLVWKDKRDVHMLTNMQCPPAEGSFCDEHVNAIKPAIVADYNKHMGYVDKAAEWQTVIASVVGPGNGQINHFSISWI